MSWAPPKYGMLRGFKSIGLCQQLSAADKRVACAILDHYNHGTGRCDPSRETLATLLGMNVRSVSRSISKIEKSGLFEVHRHAGSSNCNRYQPKWASYLSRDHEWMQRRRNHSMRFADQNLSPSKGQIRPLPPDKNVLQTSSTNLLLSTSGSAMKNSAVERIVAEPGTGLCSPSPDQAEVAWNKAEQRWNKELLNICGKESSSYARIVEIMTNDMQRQATEAELKRRGGGIDYVQRALVKAKL